MLCKKKSMIVFFIVGFLIVGTQIVSANSIPLAELRTPNEQGVSTYVGQYVTVEGVAAVDSGLWHDSANYFAIVDPEDHSKGVLIYLPGTTQPQVKAGDYIRATGEVSVRGYATDIGTLVLIPARPEDVEIVKGDGVLQLEAEKIHSDEDPGVLASLEGGFVEIEGRISDYSNSGIVRGFWLDGSSDGNVDDREGVMYVKFYNYHGIDISHLHDNSYVVAQGILLKGNERHGGYYIRPVDGQAFVEIADRTLPPDLDGKIPGLPFELGKTSQFRDYGLIELVKLETSLPLNRGMFPEWRPDGSGVVAAVGVEEGARITREAAETNLFLFGISGSTVPQQLTFNTYPYAYPRWSPDGETLAYAAAPNLDDQDGTWDIYTAREIDEEDGIVEEINITNHPSFDITPAWSPDGESLIFASNRTGKWELWWQSLSSDDGAVQLTDGEEDVLFPDWSEHGVLFQKRDDDGRFGIYEAELIIENGQPQLGSVRCLTEQLPGSHVYPRWSPKGDRIAFMSTAAGQWDIWMIEKDGSPAQLTKMEGSFLYPAWHPNGRRLVLVGDIDQPSLYIMDVSRALKAPVSSSPKELNPIKPKLEDNVVGGPINHITLPLLTQPALVKPGQTITLSLRDVPEKSVTIRIQSEDYVLKFSGIQCDGQVVIRLPELTPFGTYDLLIETASVQDRQPRAVVVKKPASGFTFAIVTDIHPDTSYADPENKLLPVIEELNTVQPDFVVFLGDLLAKNADKYADDYPELYELLLNHAQFPMYMVMGNHDGKVSGDVSGFSYWQGYFGSLYYNFEWGDWQFITVNTYDYPDYPSENGFVKQEQLDWLAVQLKAAQEENKPTAVFLHHNPFDSRWRFIDEGQKELRDLLETYGVSHVFAGHRHSDQFEQEAAVSITTTKWVEGEGEGAYRLVTVKGSHIVQLHNELPKKSVW